MAEEPKGGEEPQKPEEPKGGEEPAKGEEPKKEEPKPPWGSDEEFDPQRAWRLIQDVRSDADKRKAEAEELRQKVQKHEDAAKTDEEKLEARATSAEKERDQARQDAARLRIALKKGLTETQAKRLVGESEEDLEKDADELLESFKQEDEEGKDPPRRPRERLRPGAAPASEPEENDPAKLAEKVPRGW